jgi:hypothetical protein
MIEMLVVTKSFQSFVRGDIIADPAKIREVLNSDNVSSIRPVASSVAGKG